MGLGIGVVATLVGLLLVSGTVDLPGVLDTRVVDLGVLLAGAALIVVALVVQTLRNRARNTGR